MNFLARHEQKLNVFKTFAVSLGDLSVCKRKKVGCIIFPPDFTNVCSIGYNGPPAGFSADYCTGIKGQCGCVHAEPNALIKLSSHRTDLILLCTTSPCAMCASLIINSKRIASVYYATPHSNVSGVILLKKAKINVVHIQ